MVRLRLQVALALPPCSYLDHECVSLTAVGHTHTSSASAGHTDTAAVFSPRLILNRNWGNGSVMLSQVADVVAVVTMHCDCGMGSV
mgnify:CR=1 FL=1